MVITMSQFPNSPKLVKGALLEFGDALLGLVPNIVLFQYNPEQLSHKLAKTPSQDADQTATTERRENQRVSNLPIETIEDLKLFLDATDKMEGGDPITAVRGIGPAIAALEMMLFPIGTSQINIRSLLGGRGSGSAVLQPLELPLVLFVYGPWRIVPVHVHGVHVVEQEFDQFLNPIQAEVTVTLKVLSKDNLTPNTFGYFAYDWTQKNREINAALYTVQQAAGLLPF
jgi:hypothetical protein